jgi:anti-sigma-K factor RskA
MSDELRSYIESGILEEYLNGTLSEAESREVDRMADAHPEVRAELEEIRSAIMRFGPAAGGPRPPSWEEVRQHLFEGGASAPVLPLRPRYTRLWAAAASILLAVSVLLNIWLSGSLRSSRLESERLRAETAYIQQQYQAALQPPQTLADPAFVLNGPGFVPVEMRGLARDPDARVMVYWHGGSRRVFLHIHQLPEPPPGHQYQLWAIIHGVSVDAGIFDHNHGMQQLRIVDGAVEAFAVTLESAGGSPVPTLERMYASGPVQM